MQEFREWCIATKNIEDIPYLPISIELAKKWEQEGYVDIIGTSKMMSMVHVKLTDKGIVLFRSVH